jgi:hypothetical protein
MAAIITGATKFNLNLTYNNNTVGAPTVTALSVSNSPGSSGVATPDISFQFGAGTTLATGNIISFGAPPYIWQGTIAATTQKSITMNGGSDVDVTGTALALTKCRYFCVTVLDPDGIISVQVGPKGITNAWQGPWGGVGATVYEQVAFRKEWIGIAAGLAVTPSTAMIFGVYNPGAATITVQIVIAGS